MGTRYWMMDSSGDELVFTLFGKHLVTGEGEMAPMAIASEAGGRALPSEAILDPSMPRSATPTTAVTTGSATR